MKHLAVLLLLAGCGAAVPDRGVVLECHALECPSQSDVSTMVHAFAEEATGFDPYAPLTVEWHADGEAFRFYVDDEERHAVIAQTLKAGGRVQTSSVRLLVHELAHVWLYQITGDGDANHAAEGGAWVPGTDATIARAEARIAELLKDNDEDNGSPSEDHFAENLGRPGRR